LFISEAVGVDCQFGGDGIQRDLRTLLRAHPYGRRNNGGPGRISGYSPIKAKYSREQVGDLGPSFMLYDISDLASRMEAALAEMGLDDLTKDAEDDNDFFIEKGGWESD
jgi:hypothetical protein